VLTPKAHERSTTTISRSSLVYLDDQTLYSSLFLSYQVHLNGNHVNPFRQNQKIIFVKIIWLLSFASGLHQETNKRRQPCETLTNLVNMANQWFVRGCIQLSENNITAWLRTSSWRFYI